MRVCSDVSWCWRQRISISRWALSGVQRLNHLALSAQLHCSRHAAALKQIDYIIQLTCICHLVQAQLTQLLLFSNAIVRNNHQMTLQLQRLQAPQLPQPPLSPAQYATASAAAAAGGAGLLLQTDTLSTNSALEPPSLSTLVACAGLTGLNIHPLSVSDGLQSPSSAVLGLGAMAAGLRAPVAPPPPQPPQPGRPTLPAATRVGSPCGDLMMMPAIPGVQVSLDWAAPIDHQKELVQREQACPCP